MNKSSYYHDFQSKPRVRRWKQVMVDGVEIIIPLPKPKIKSVEEYIDELERTLRMKRPIDVEVRVVSVEPIRTTQQWTAKGWQTVEV